MPGKRSLGALLHIYSPRYFKSDPGDLPERPEKSPTLWGPLTRKLYILKISGSCFMHYLIIVVVLCIVNIPRGQSKSKLVNKGHIFLM